MRETPDHKTLRTVGGSDDHGNVVYGAARLALAKLVKVALDEAGVVWFLDGGTLLGAYRNGQQIPHDDDFDMAVYFPDFKGEQDLIALTHAMRSLPSPYETRTVTSYATKLEVYDRTSEVYPLPPQYKGADFHVVTVDLQIITSAPDDERFAVYLHALLQHVRVPKDAIEPTGEVVCEGATFNCPHQTARFLEAQYGYIGADAQYDQLTRMFVKADKHKPQG